MTRECQRALLVFEYTSREPKRSSARTRTAGLIRASADPEGGDTDTMSTAMIPASADDALDMLESVMGFLAGLDPVDLPEATVSRTLRMLERVDAIEAAVRGRFLAAVAAQEGPVSDGQRSIRAWLVHSLGVTKGQAAEYQALQALARDHPVLWAALAEGDVHKSVALQLAKWTKAI